MALYYHITVTSSFHSHAFLASTGSSVFLPPQRLRVELESERASGLGGDQYRLLAEENHELKLELERERAAAREANVAREHLQRELASKAALAEQLADSAHRAR